ncbi:hypothetical protein U0070_016170, partial [Myodes glareolus]
MRAVPYPGQMGELSFLSYGFAADAASGIWTTLQICERAPGMNWCSAPRCLRSNKIAEPQITFIGGLHTAEEIE